MALTCPNINMPEWSALEEAVGKMEAYRDYMETDGLIRTPDVVKAKLEHRNTSYQLAGRIKEQNISINMDVIKGLLKTLANKFGEGYGYRIAEPDPTGKWRGKLEPPTEANGNKPTVVINPALVRLDTPLHEFGHIFVAMIKQNKRLYSSLIKQLRVSDDFQSVLAKTKEDYTEDFQTEGLSGKELQFALEEEAIVELLGLYAAEQIDPDTGLLKAIERVWDAIKKILQDILNDAGVIDVLNITPNATLEEIANLLVHPEVKFVVGAEKQADIDRISADLENVYKKEQAILASIEREAAEGNLEKWMNEGWTYVINKETAEYFKKLTTNPLPDGTGNPPLLQLVDYLYDNFDDDLKTVFADAARAPVDTNVEQYLTNVKDKYKWLFFSLKMKYDSSDMDNLETKLVTALASPFGNDTVNRASSNVRDITREVHYSREWQTLTSYRGRTNPEGAMNNIISETLSGDQPGLNRMFRDHVAYMSDLGIANRDVSDIVQDVKDRTDQAAERLKQVKSGALLGIKTNMVRTVPIDSVNPRTGEVTKEKITVTLDSSTRYEGKVSVQFSSDIFSMNDPYYDFGLGLQEDINPGKTKLAFVKTGGQDPYTQDAVAIKDEGLNVIVAARKPTFINSAEELDDAEIDALYDEIYAEYRTRPGSFRVVDPMVGPEKVRIEYATASDRELKLAFGVVSDEYYYKIPKSQVRVLESPTRERQSAVIQALIDSMSHLLVGETVSSFHFSAVDGQSMSRHGNAMRDGLYKLIGRALFHDYHVELEPQKKASGELRYQYIEVFRPDRDIETKLPVYPGMVIVPRSFRKGLILDKTLYQKTPAEEVSFPFENELEESVIGQAILTDVKENSTDPVLSDQTEAVSLATSLSDVLGVSYQVLTADEAAALTADSPNPWSGEKAFFIGDMVYFVGDNLTTKDVFHEFAHPFIRHIAGTNPALFSRLYKQLSETAEGQAIIAEVSEMYPDLDSIGNMDLFKEEVIVRALTAIGMDKLNKFKTESAFAKVINNILYAIKQALRKIFGKVPVSGLAADTTLEELADILVKGGKFEVDKTIIGASDVIAYNKERTQYIDDLINIDDNSVQSILNKEFDIASNHLNQLLTNRNYDALANLLTDEDKRGDLQELKSNLQAYQTSVSNMASRTVKDMEYMRNRSTALVNSMFRLKTVMGKILEHAQDMKAHGESQENLHKAHYYDHLIKHWQQFIDEAVDTLNEQELDDESPMFTLLDQIKRSTTKTRKIINEMYAEGARDGLYNELMPTQQHIKEKYDGIIQDLRDKGASQKKIDRYYKQYHGVTEAEHDRLKELKRMRKSGVLPKAQENEMNNLQAKADQGIAITPEKIEQILKGGMGDANFFNSYLEGYLYNTDPVIGGLASYVKNNLNEVMAKAQGVYNNFSKEMQPLLEDAGFNPNKPGDLGEQLGFLDTVAKKEEDGTITPRKVWTFLNPFRDYRHDYDVHKDTVEKAQAEYHRTGTDEAEKAMTDAVVARQKFMRKYFHQEYVPEFYERDALFEKDEVGKAALLKRKQWSADYRALTEPANTPEQQLEITGQVDLMWRQWRQMSSIYTLEGTLKTGMEKDIALRIKEYNELSRPFYETRPRKGVFQNALKTYEQKLIDEGNPVGSEEFKRKRAIWISQNVVKVPKQTWYNRTRELYDRQKEILKKLDPEMRKAMDEQAIMDQIFDLQGGFKDEYGQTKAVELSPESRAKVIALEKELQEMRATAVARNGLTPQQNERLSLLHEIRKAGRLQLPDGTTQAWNHRLQKELSALHNLKDTMGLTKFERDELESIRAELAGISKREATSYYVDIMNNWLANPNLTLPPGAIPSVNKNTADSILEPAVINRLLGQNAEFDAWFRASHLLKDKWNPITKQMEKVWTRSTVWSQTIPIDPSQYETFEVKDEAGNIEVIQGKPIQKYFSRVVKQEFRKEKIVGVTVDNKYKWLPKSREEGSRDPNWDSKYINDEYEEMRANDPAKFKALEKMKEWHLRNQEGISSKGRLYYDYPRYRQENLELMQSKDLLTNLVKRVKGWFHGLKDDAEQGFNDKDQLNLVRMDIFDNDITDVPIHGLYDIDHQDVSTDITLTMMQYMLSGERQKQLMEISPMAKAVQSVVSAEANKIDRVDSKGFKFINKFNFFNNGVISFGKQKGDSVRKKTIDNFIEREFEGKRMTGAGSDVPWLNNTASLLFKRASFGFFAFNIPSALKNSYGAKFQGLIEASAGEHMTHLSFQKGNVWSYGTMGELSFGGQLYKKGPKSLRQQLVEIFDPSQDRFEDTFGEGLSRTISKDAAGMTWLYNFRKWVELQATIQVFAGMMYHQTVSQTINGETKEIPYMEAWELRDEKIQLKEGVDPAWGITYDEEENMKMGAKFSRYKNTMQAVQRNLQGAYAKFDQPEAQRYLAFRFLSYLRRYFTTMTMNRFGFSGRWGDPQPRLNVGLGDVQMGYYIQFIQTLKDTITDLGRNLMFLTGPEKKAAFKVMTELGALFATTIAMSLLFGWDPDDDERFEKLRERSGALPFPLTSEDPDRPFNGWGFMENHMLYLLMNIRSENEQFLPFPGYGLDDYSAMLDLKSIAFGPTVQTYKEIFEDSLDIMQGSESAYYKRDVGPYKYQQEGGAKIWAHIGRTLGLTGSALDPAKGIKGFQSVQARARR
jgi:hypothetical protein